MKFPSVPVTQNPAGEEAGSASRGSDSLKTPGHFSCSTKLVFKLKLIHNAAASTSKTYTKQTPAALKMSFPGKRSGFTVTTGSGCDKRSAVHVIF